MNTRASVTNALPWGSFRFLSKGPIRVAIPDLGVRVHNSCLSYESNSSGFNIFLVPTCTQNPSLIVKLIAPKPPNTLDPKP